MCHGFYGGFYGGYGAYGGSLGRFGMPGIMGMAGGIFQLVVCEKHQVNGNAPRFLCR